MFCEKCGTQLSETDKFCTSCGNPNPAANSAQQASAGQAAPVQEPTPVQQAAPAQEAVVTDTPAPKAPKGGKGKVVVLGVACVAVVALVIGLISSLGNFFRRTFSSPEKYYAYVETQQADELVSMIVAYYDNYVKGTEVTNNGANVELLVEIGEELRDMIGYADVDVSWLENVSVALETSIKDEKIGLSAALKANKESVLSGNVAIDLAEEFMYFQLPDLNKTYLGMEFDDAGFDYDDEIWEQLDGVTKKLPDAKKVEKLLQKYVEIALKRVEDVDKDKDTLEAEDVSAKYMTLEVTIDEDTLQDMAEAVFEEMLEDKDLEELILQVAEMDENADGDEIYESFIEGIEYASDNLDDIYLDEEIVMTVWVDSKGEVKGRMIEYGDVVITYAMPEKGSKFGFELSYDDGYNSAALLGSGKTSGKKLSGEFYVKYDSARYVDILVENYNTDKIKEGYLNGKFTVSLAKATGKLIGTSGASVVSALADYSLVLDVESSDKSAKATVAVLDGEDQLVAVDVTAKTGKGSKVSVPASKNVAMLDDSDDMEDWVEDIDFSKFLDKLEDKIGVPSDYIDAIEEMLEYYLDY